ncbi:TIGR01777 family oxidoreductase [Nocardiopsis dassonvillei]|uniref:TIGR01777 family oxidoreductase n=1 Tax=Nocardiopsis dassonvillei TaxID=2014 RepID=UPI00102AC2BD|nr:TIGR01777 family oxidoreductase [Nocardiopsis dassonvillei]MCP3016820.1 TIGR01777 family oxidoreductase [Nocardiopsis dassonvillei]
MAITGATGLIGRALEASLLGDGHTVVRMVRHLPRGRHHPDVEEAEWRPEQGRVDTVALHEADAVVHLAGAPVGPALWTRHRRTLIRRSRVRGTRTLCQALAGMSSPPPRLLSASGMHFYGDTGERAATEDSPPGSGFLAGVCRDWEEATAPAEEAGLSVAHMRTSVVLDRSGGMLGTLLPLYRAGLGGRLGSGRQYMSWIAMRDQIGAVRFLLEHPEITGPVNMCAPEPVTNAEFTRALGRALRRPAVLPVPAPVMRAVLGDFAEETALIDMRAEPERLTKAGYSFALPTVDSALSDILARPAQSTGA